MHRREHHVTRVILLLMLFPCQHSIVSATCPSPAQRAGLVRAEDAAVTRCDCDSDRPGEWEVTCFRVGASGEASAVPGHGATDLRSGATSQPSFVIKYTNSDTIEITCDESLPDLKPAMFQGFNVDAVDSFKVSNCPLPALPLSVIFHRTSLARLHHREELANSSQVDDEVVSEVRSLTIEFSAGKNVSANHLKNLFNGLDALEKLTLHKVQLEVGKENSASSSLTAPAAIFYARPKRFADSVSPAPSTTAAAETTFASGEDFGTDSPGLVTSFAPISPSSSSAVQFSPSSRVTTTRAAASSRSSVTSSPTSSAPSFVSTRSESRPVIAIDRDIRVPDTGSRSISSQKPASVIPPSILNADFNLNNLMPKVKSININAMFTQKVQFNGLILERMMKDLKMLESVRLTGNSITELGELTFSGSATSLRFLYLFGNEIQALHPRIFANLVNLQTLDLFNNDLNRLPTGIFADLTSLSSLRMGKNKFESLAENLLWPMKGLKAIDLNLNRNLSFLPKRFLSGSVSLQNFSMTDCDLDQLTSDPSSFFASAPSLERIDMRGNRLHNLTAPGLFAGNPALKKIDLSYNSIAFISSEIFSSNSSSIVELNLHGNELTAINSSTLDLTQLKNLRHLKLGFNNIALFSAEVLFSLRKLEELDLSRNHLTTINPSLSRLPFGQGSAHLRRLNLSRNNITDFTEFSAIDWSLYLKIAELDLSRNQIEGPILLPVFYSTAPHVILDLSSNQIRSVLMGEILHYESGVSQAARDGRMSESLEERSSTWRPSQVIIRLDKNPLTCDCRLEPFLSYANTSSRDLEAALRGILNRVSFDFFSPNLKCAQPPNLADVPLHKIDPWNLTCLLEDPRICPHDCVCLYRSRDKHAYVNCENHNLESIPEEILNPSRYRNVSLSENGITERLGVKTVSLLLSNNAITDISSLYHLYADQEPELLSGDGIYFEVYLDGNQIERIPADLLKQIGDPEAGEDGIGGEFAVRVLSLRNNYLQRIPIPFLESIRASASSSSSQNRSDLPLRLFLGSNPYNCSSEGGKILPANITDCGLISFKSWLTKNYDIVLDVKQVTCDIIRNTVPLVDTPTPIVEIPDADLCPQLLLSNESGFFVPSVLCLILSLVSLVLCVAYYRNKQTFLAFIYIHVQPVFVCLNFSEHDLDEDKLYDAFVSYSSSDRDIVMEMIAQLEGPSDVTQHSISFLKQQTGIPSIHEGNSDQIVPEHAINCKSSVNNSKDGGDGSFFSLCIHERDWLPGNLISWNIINSVQNSRRTVLVLSKEFIRSIWFQVEFHTAYYQMLEDKMDRLIVVVRGDLPPKEEMDQDLVFLLTTKTYLTWGEKWFWEKLRYALPHKKNPKSVVAKLPTSKEKPSFTTTMNGKGKQSKADLMKQYVDQTISDHFQLQQKTMDRNHEVRNHPSAKSGPIRGHVNQSFVSESEA